MQTLGSTKIALVVANIEVYSRSSQSPQKPFDLAQISPDLLLHMASRITATQVKFISGAATMG